MSEESSFLQSTFRRRESGGKEFAGPLFKLSICLSCLFVLKIESSDNWGFDQPRSGTRSMKGCLNRAGGEGNKGKEESEKEKVRGREERRGGVETNPCPGRGQ